MDHVSITSNLTCNSSYWFFAMKSCWNSIQCLRFLFAKIIINTKFLSSWRDNAEPWIFYYFFFLFFFWWEFGVIFFLLQNHSCVSRGHKFILSSDVLSNGKENFIFCKQGISYGENSYRVDLQFTCNNIFVRRNFLPK